MKTRNLLVSVLMLVGVLLSACAPAATPSQAPTAISPTAVPSNQITFHSPENASFRLPLAFSYSPEWDVQVGINALDIIHKGNPLEPQSAWWGPSIFIVNGAQVADPKDGITKIPLPEDFFAYVSSFPTVKVIQGPDQVTIGGVEGKQMIIHTSTGRCFGLWLKDDFTWLGIGSNCGDGKSQIILLDVNGEQVLLWFPESPEKFDERYLLVQEIFNSITFGK